MNTKELEHLIESKERQLEILKFKLSDIISSDISFSTDLSQKEQEKYAKIGIYCILRELSHYYTEYKALI